MSALEIADIIGIISFALSGFLIAVHCKLDILGVFISAFLTAFGGGMTRDVLADRTPYVFTSNLPLSLVIATVLIAMLFKLHKITNLEGKWAFVISDAIGLSSFAISGAIIAIESGFNFLSAVMLAFITAVGGGTIRDVLADRTPYVFTSNLPLSLVIATVLIAMLFKLHKITNLEGKWAFVISDAIGLSSFAITGAIIAIESGFNFLSAVMLAFITAVGGGTIRDVLINRMPFILVSEFYATVALIIGSVVYILDAFELRNIFSLIIVFIFGVVLRVLAYYKKWHLPTLSKEN